MQTKRVLVVMSTYNGEKYVAEQLDSIIRQRSVEIVLRIRDDGSKDNTAAILNKYAMQNQNIRVAYGDNLGFEKSFFEALKSDNISYDYYAFADQDDVWDEDKLITAIEALEQEPAKIKMYASGMNVTDSNLQFQTKHSFSGIRINYGSALSRQRLAGCTMVFSSALKELVQKMNLGENKQGRLSHDALVYYVCLLCGGKVIFCPEGKINFRRHAGTVTENGKGLIIKLLTIVDVFGKRKLMRFYQNKRLYECYGASISCENMDLVKKIIKYRDNIKSTLSLFCDKRVSCGIKSVDLINRLAILFRCY